jgi:hypothetical protein
MVLRLRDAIAGQDDPVDWVYTGHSHFDHSFDSPLWSALTGAQLIGSQTTCLQALAQNLPPQQCTEVLGGERIHFGRGVTGYVVRWNHSGDPAVNPEQHNPVELTTPPIPDKVTGGLRGGVAEDYPNGGGGRMMLFVVERNGRKITFFVNNSASAVDLTDPIIVDGVNYGAPLDNLRRAMQQAGLHAVDLWIGTGGAPVAQLVVPVLHPRAYIPNHWDGLFNPFLPGLPFPYSDPTLASYLAAQHIPIYPQTQYMDGFLLTRDGVKRLENRRLKAKLGFSVVQQFPATTAQSRLSAAADAQLDDCN